jgi:hydrogenase maturation protease
VGAWPGKVVVIACEPAGVEEMGLGLSSEVEAAVERAVELVLSTIEELRSDAAYAQE